MTKPGPPRPKGKTNADEPSEVEEETTTVQAAPAHPEADLEATIADPPSDDLLETTELRAIGAVDMQDEPEEEDDPNKAYLAPQVIPTPAVPDQNDAQRIVLNLPDQSAVLPPSPRDVDRARRRAPTVKIPRATLAERGVAAAASPQLPPAPPPAPKPVAPIARTEIVSRSEKPASRAKSPAIDEQDESPLLSLPSEPRAEAPPTALHVSASPPARRSRLPYVALAALFLGVGAFAVVTLDKEDKAASAGKDAAPAAQQGDKPAPQTAAPAPPDPAPTQVAAAPPPTEPPPAESAAALSVTSLPPATSQPVAANGPPVPPRPPAPPPTAYTPPATPPKPPVAAPPKPPPAKPLGKDYTPPTI